MSRPLARAVMMLGALVSLSCRGEAPVPTDPSAVDTPSFARGGEPARSHVASQHWREPFAAVVHACDGDVIGLAGTAHHKVAAFATPSARVHFRLHSNLQGVGGVGVPSGTRYRLVEVAGANYNYEADGLAPFETNHILNYRLIGAGPNNDRVVRVRFHITIAANGHVAVARHHVDAECEK